MKLFFKITTGYIFFYHKRREDILEELNIEPADKKLRRYKSNWLRHLTTMDGSRMAKMLNCRPIGRKRHGRSLKRLLDEAEKDLLRPNW